VVKNKYDVKTKGIYIGKLQNPRGKVKYGFLATNVFTVRFADDVVVLARSKRMIEETVKPCIGSFLKERGLWLSDEKTQILSIRKGDKLNFLGYTFQYFNKVAHRAKMFNDRQGREAIVCYPQKGKYEGIIEKTRTLFETSYNLTAYTLIAKLNPIIRG
jgi:RNA-directed DNA polymerase